MADIYIDSYNIISALGKTADENYVNITKSITGVKVQVNQQIDQSSVLASLIDEKLFDDDELNLFSKYEKLLLYSVNDALKKSDIDAASENTLFVFSTTKGNISLLDKTTDEEELSLFNSAEKITHYFKNNNQPVVISNACISGVVALIYASRIMLQGKFKNVIVTGADCINKFIYSGFNSFMALSPGLCKPFSSTRDGINLGEAAATIILSDSKSDKSKVKVLKGAITNDANHISGPSRTGEELSNAILCAIRSSELQPVDIDFISAHGTATGFNDQMEANAFALSGLSKTPVNSLKGYFGHTLGAAGLVESIINIIALEKDDLIPTKGFENPVLNPAVNVSETLIQNQKLNHFIKTASGFGGCNAALVFSKMN